MRGMGCRLMRVGVDILSQLYSGECIADGECGCVVASGCVRVRVRWDAEGVGVYSLCGMEVRLGI